MFKKTIIAGLVVSAFAPALASAADSPHTFTGNMGIYSQYIFRGVSQTDGKPALQGGFDYSHSSGLYAGTWMSNVSWTKDAFVYSGGGSLEADFYGGYKGTIGKSDFGYDVGLLQYYYPGTVFPGATKADTLEAYVGLSWKWLSLKYSHAISNKTFTVPNSRGTDYIDLTANFPVTDKLTALVHYGKAKFDGTTLGVSNDSFASFDDWKIGVSYALPKDFTIGAFYSDTKMTALQELFYTNPTTGKFWGKGQGTVYVSKTF